MKDRRFLWRRLGRGVLALALAALYAPMMLVFVYSFNASRLGSVWTEFSPHWYGALFANRSLWAALRTSLIVGGAASTVSLVLGTLAALGLRRWHRRSRRLAGGLLALPLVLPDMILAVSLALFFHGLGVGRGLTTVVLAHVAFGLSYAYVVVAAAVEDLDENLYAAALDCGATPGQAFRLVLVPTLAPSLVVAWLLVFALSFDDFLITFFTKGVGNDTLPIKIYAQMRFGVRPETNALFVLLFAATLAGVGVSLLLARRRAGLPPRPVTE